MDTWANTSAHNARRRWERKAPTLVWRGTMTGGHQRPPLAPGEWRRLHRHRLVEWANGLGRTAPRPCGGGRVTCDVAFTAAFPNAHPSYREQQLRDYPVAGAISQLEQSAAKYILDVDGNSWTRRFIPLLHYSGSLLLKLTVFEQPERTLLRPFAHYIPVDSLQPEELDATLSALDREDGVAASIARAGQEVTQRWLRKEDMQCYWFRLLLEYHSLASRR